ncbi:MAG TPA: hypothetical protein VH597_13880 [Verrucomicrobiae bacterium]|jgi:hypothetical protein|nr:hypothetical protein [Verrucomicrobiae bacterium]
MKKPFGSVLICCWVLLSVLAGCFRLSAAGDDTNVYTLKLTGTGTFKDIFDAGLRPERSGDGLNLCLVQDKTITFDLGNGNAITIPASLCMFRVLGDDSLYDIEATSPPLSLDEARSWMLPICIKFGKTARDLDNFLDRVRDGYRGFGWLGDNNAGFVMGMPAQPRNSGLGAMGARFQSMGRNANTKRPIQIAVDVRWERSIKELLPHTSPLVPPKGYEQYSMDPQEHIPSWVRNGEEAPNFVKALHTPEEIQQIRDHYKNQGADSASPRDPSPRDGVIAAASPSNKSFASSKWLLAAALVVAVAGWILVRGRKGSGTPPDEPLREEVR